MTPALCSASTGTGGGEIGEQGSQRLATQPSLVFSRFQHLLFLEVGVPVWWKYLRVLCTLLILGHFSSFFGGGGVGARYSFSHPPLDSKP